MQITTDLFDFDIPDGSTDISGWTRDCGGKMDFDPSIIRMFSRVYPDGNINFAIYVGGETEAYGLQNKFDTQAQGMAEIERLSKVHAEEIIATIKELYGFDRPIKAQTEFDVDAPFKWDAKAQALFNAAVECREMAAKSPGLGSCNYRPAEVSNLEACLIEGPSLHDMRFDRFFSSAMQAILTKHSFSLTRVVISDIVDQARKIAIAMMEVDAPSDTGLRRP